MSRPTIRARCQQTKVNWFHLLRTVSLSSPAWSFLSSLRGDLVRLRYRHQHSPLSHSLLFPSLFDSIRTWARRFLSLIVQACRRDLSCLPPFAFCKIQSSLCASRPLFWTFSPTEWIFSPAVPNGGPGLLFYFLAFGTFKAGQTFPAWTVLCSGWFQYSKV